MIFYPDGITGHYLEAGDFGKLFLTESLAFLSFSIMLIVTPMEAAKDLAPNNFPT